MSRHFKPSPIQRTKDVLWKNDQIDRIAYRHLIPDPSNIGLLIDEGGQRWKRLNESQKIFVEQLVAGESIMSALKISGRSTSVWSNTSQADLLQRFPVVGNYYLELCEKRRASSTVSKEDHLMKLAEIRDLALADKKWSPAITAEIARGRVEGHYIQKIEVEHTSSSDMTADELTRKLEERLTQIFSEKLTDVVEVVDTPVEGITNGTIE